MLSRYGVFDDMFDLFHDLDRLFRRPAGVRARLTTSLPAAATFQPAVSCFTHDNQLVVRAELPGVNPDDVEVNVMGDQLVIRGEKKDQTEVKECDVHFMEVSRGRFERWFRLPEEVKKEQVRATLSNGVLEVTVPAEGIEAARKVPIEVTGGGKKAIKAA